MVGTLDPLDEQLYIVCDIHDMWRRDAAQFHETYSTPTTSHTIVVIPHQDRHEVPRKRIQNTRSFQD